MEALEWPTRVVSYLQEQDRPTRKAFKSSTQLTRLSLMLILGISFTIFIYGLLLDRLSWLFVLLARNDQNSASITEYLLIFGYMTLASGFSYYLFSWILQQYRVHVMLREITKSKLELEPVLISSRQPVLFARSSSRFIRNVVIQGIKKRFLSLSAHLQLPYNTKFADFHLEILQEDVAHREQSETFHVITVPNYHRQVENDNFSSNVSNSKPMSSKKNGVFQLIFLKKRMQAHFLLTSDIDAYAQLTNCLKHHKNEFEALVSDKRFKYMSIDQVDRGGHAVYKIHVHYKGKGRSVVRHMMRFLEILTDTLVSEHEPMVLPSDVLAREDFQDLRKYSSVSGHSSPLSSSRHEASSAPEIHEKDHITSTSDSNRPFTSAHATSSESVGRKIKIDGKALQDLQNELLFPKSILTEIEKLLVHVSSIEVVSPTHLILRSTSPTMNTLHWELDKADKDILQLRIQGMNFSFTQTFFFNLWRNSKHEQWKIDATISRDLVARIISDPIVGSCLNNFIPPIYLNVSSTRPEMLEMRVIFSIDIVENIHHAYILAQELPWLLLLLV